MAFLGWMTWIGLHWYVSIALSRRSFRRTISPLIENFRRSQLRAIIWIPDTSFTYVVNIPVCHSPAATRMPGTIRARSPGGVSFCSSAAHVIIVMSLTSYVQCTRNKAPRITWSTIQDIITCWSWILLFRLSASQDSVGSKGVPRAHCWSNVLPGILWQSARAHLVATRSDERSSLQ